MTARRISWALRLGLGGLFLAAGVLKLADPSSFARQIENFQLLPGLAPYLAVALPPTEIVAGLALLAGTRRWRPAAALTLAALTGVFTVAVGSAVARGIDTSCGCFGSGGGPVSPLTVARNLGLLAAALALLRLERGGSAVPRPAPAGTARAPVAPGS